MLQRSGSRWAQLLREEPTRELEPSHEREMRNQVKLQLLWLMVKSLLKVPSLQSCPFVLLQLGFVSAGSRCTSGSQWFAPPLPSCSVTCGGEEEEKRGGGTKTKSGWGREEKAERERSDTGRVIQSVNRWKTIKCGRRKLAADERGNSSLLDRCWGNTCPPPPPPPGPGLRVSLAWSRLGSRCSQASGRQDRRF